MSSEYIQQQIQAASELYFHSPEAEENILRRMMKKPETAEDIAEQLTGNDFYDRDNGRLFCAIKDCVRGGVQVDFMAVDMALTRMFPKHAERLRTRMVDLVAPKPYTLADGQAITDVVKLVRDLSRRRQAMAKMDALSEKLRDPSLDINDTLLEIQGVADATATDDTKWMSVSEVNMHTFEYLEKRTSGEIKAIPTGITAIDRMTGGFFGGELTIIAARPSVGKSAFGLNIAYAAAYKGFKVGFVSCEMSDIGFGQRTLSRSAHVNGGTLRKAEIAQEDWDSMATALAASSDTQIWFLFQKDNPNGMNVESVVKSARRRAKAGNLDILIVDYIGILQTVRRFRENRDRIAYISWELKRLAQVANIPVIALCQVNRDAQGQMPTMAQLRDSGSIEQDADSIIFLHRPESHEDKSIHKDDVRDFYAVEQSGNVYISICVAKQRNGSTGTCNVLFNPGTMTYTQILRTEDIKQ